MKKPLLILAMTVLLVVFMSNLFIYKLQLNGTNTNWSIVAFVDVIALILITILVKAHKDFFTGVYSIIILTSLVFTGCESTDDPANSAAIVNNNKNGCLSADGKDAVTKAPVPNVFLLCITKQDFDKGTYKQTITNISDWSNFSWTECSKCPN